MLFLSISRIISLLIACLVGEHTVQSEETYRTSWAKQDEVPYHASIWLRDDFLCSATIIDFKFVLTVAHCVVGLSPEYYPSVKVKTGTISTRRGGQTHCIEAIHIHPEYAFLMSQVHANDIAVIKLAEYLVMNQTQRGIAIAKEGPADPPVDAKAIVSGWGRSYYDEMRPTSLRKAVTSLISSIACQEKLHYTLRPNQICAFDKTERNVCIVDSGSPLVDNNKLIGMLSWAGKCGSVFPEVYVKTAPYRVFIAQAMSLK